MSIFTMLLIIAYKLNLFCLACEYKYANILTKPLNLYNEVKWINLIQTYSINPFKKCWLDIKYSVFNSFVLIASLEGAVPAVCINKVP